VNEYEGLSEDQIKLIERSPQRVIESVGKNMDLYGVTLSIGHLYGHMYFSNDPVTLDDMGETLGMSKTSMSTGMRTLMDLKMVQKVWGKGTRKDLYVVESDWYQNFIDYFSVKWRKSTEMNLAAMQKSLSELNSYEKNHPDSEAFLKVIERDRAKIRHAMEYYNWLLRLIDSMENGDIFNFLPKETV